MWPRSNVHSCPEISGDPYNVCLVGGAKLYFDFVSPLCLRVLKQQIKPPGARLNALLVAQHEITKPQNSRVLGYTVLYPTLAQLGMGF
jgi:hypothetical protein